MAETTAIAWAEASWNPWLGCSKVSPGCTHCYAETLMVNRMGRDFNTVQRAAPATFNAPLKWKDPKRIFTCSLSDFFHQKADLWREEAWEIIKATPRHTYQILTKRPGLMAAWARTHGWPENAWAGTSVESAKYLPRLDVLARVPAAVRFVSAEPLLGCLNLRQWLPDPKHDRCIAWDIPGHDHPGVLSWVIVGGESGKGFRPMQMIWVNDIAIQCKQAGIPLFVKQAAGLYPGRQGKLPDDLWALKEMPNG